MNSNLEEVKKRIGSIDLNIKKINETFDTNIKEATMRIEEMNNRAFKDMKIFQQECEKESKIISKTNNVVEESLEQDFVFFDREKHIEEIAKVVSGSIPDLEDKLFASAQMSLANYEMEKLTVSSNESDVALPEKNSDVKQEPLRKLNDIISVNELEAVEEKNKENSILAEKSIKSSVKGKNKIKYKIKKRKIDWDEVKLTAKVILIGSAIGITTLTTAALSVDTIKAAHFRNEAQEKYVDTILTPNTQNDLSFENEKAKPIHSHDWEKIIAEIHQEYENPIVGFYILYNNLDEDCKNGYFNTIIREFNLQYGTNYINLEDFLTKNNFKDFKEMRKYVDFEIYRLNAEKELEISGNRNSTLGR